MVSTGCSAAPKFLDCFLLHHREMKRCFSLLHHYGRGSLRISVYCAFNSPRHDAMALGTNMPSSRQGDVSCGLLFSGN